MLTKKTLLFLSMSTLSLVACRAHNDTAVGQSENNLASATEAKSAQESTQPQSGGDRKQEIIRDYPVTVESITVEATDRPALGQMKPVKLVIIGTIKKGDKTERVKNIVEGLTLPHRQVKGVSEYLTLVRSGDTIYTDRTQQAIAKVDRNNKLILEGNWNWQITHREYRYTLEDRISALLFGVLVKNDEYISVDVSPR